MAEDAENPVVNETEVADTSTTDSTPEETETSEGEFTDDSFGSNDESEEQPTEGNEDQQESSEEPEQEFKGAEKRKEQLNAEIREIHAQREQARQELEQYYQQLEQSRQQNQPEPVTKEQLLDQVNPDTGEYFTSAEADVILLQQQVQQMQQQEQQREYYKQVEQSVSQLSESSNKVLSDFPVFDSTSDQYDATIAEPAFAVLDANLIKDQKGNPIGSRIDPYKLFKAFHDANQAGLSKGAASGQKAAEKNLSNTDGYSGSRGGDKSFQNMSLKEKADYLRRKGHDI